MRRAQPLLFPDPQPLVVRLGPEFFRRAPQRPGVYLMYGNDGAILYVGKAKNLRQRLNHYRIANPDRMPRRHLRMVREVARIEFEECSDEFAALGREAELLRTVRPKFNRAGTWVPPRRVAAWRRVEREIRLAVAERFDEPWQMFQHWTGGAAVQLRVLVGRLLWATANPARSFTALPMGWSRGALTGEAAVDCGTLCEEAMLHLQQLAAGEVSTFSEWVRLRRPATHPFDATWLNGDLEWLNELTSRIRGRC